MDESGDAAAAAPPKVFMNGLWMPAMGVGAGNPCAEL